MEEGYERKILIPYANLLDFGHVIQAEVTRVSQGGVYVFGRDEPIDFDYLVVATGTSYAFPCKIADPEREDAMDRYVAVRAEIGGAGAISVIGGGPTGVEMACEIKEKFPDKEVTLIHSRDHLIPGPLRDAFKAKILEKVEAMGIQVILNDRVLLETSFPEIKNHGLDSNYIPGSRTLLLQTGVEVPTDLVFFCMGAKVNKASYTEEFASSMDISGRLRVNEFLQVQGYANIFALGDCNNWDEPKLGYAAQNQATIVAKNISALHSGKALKAYSSGHHVMIVTTGSSGGVAQLPVPGGKIMGSRFSALVKSKGLFTSNQWSLLRLKPPKDGDEASSSSGGTAADDDDVDPESVPRMAQAMQISEDEAIELLKGLPTADAEGKDFT